MIKQRCSEKGGIVDQLLRTSRDGEAGFVRMQKKTRGHTHKDQADLLVRVQVLLEEDFELALVIL